MAGLDMTWAMTMTALHIYIMAFILLINIMRRFHGLYAHLRMARFHALIPGYWWSSKEDIVFCTQSRRNPTP